MVWQVVFVMGLTSGYTAHMRLLVNKYECKMRSSSLFSVCVDGLAVMLSFFLENTFRDVGIKSI